MARRHRPREPRAGDADPGEPPTVVSGEIDHGYGFPLVDRSPGVLGVDVLDGERLGLSTGLSERLAGWAARWEVLAAREIDGEPVTPDVERRERALAADQQTLLYRVRDEIGGAELLVDGVPLQEWRRHHRR
ncbi:hypothetical protein LY71_103251 [Geodermatophilus tzadiensis]|uniref:Uncharacterized protein n=1 Tax=Geodermatophilus tzadiensis TaxID=1137988 RepID=A0A2T0TYB7_9ACTN|nr:hypothetical protein [Geodermatophilus tzadiensis]PRY50687.1 hypothetical protein LY71_103251 [Geodermatophilus tzadiensis]